MGLGSILRSGISTIHSVLGGSDGLLDTVTVRRWIRDLDAYGTKDYAAAETFQCVVVRKQQLVTDITGEEAVAKTYIAFLEELTPNGASGRREPLDERDLLTLSDGTTGPILSIEGYMDRANSTPYYHEVYLG